MSSAVLNSLIFDGIDLAKYPGCVVYKGPFGSRYGISTDCTIFKQQHGQRVVPRKGYLAGKALTIIGVYEKSLWVHDNEENVAISIKGVTNAKELEEEFAFRPAELPVGSSIIREVGALGVAYTFDASKLQELFGLKPQEPIALHGKTNCTVLGEVFGCLWVRISGVATPLPGATNEATLMSLYEISGPFDPQDGGNTPRRTASMTPRSGKPPYTLVAAKQVAVCEAAFGNTFEADTSKKAFAPFGVSHGQVLIASNGALRGKKVTIVGVHLGSLWVLVDGDRRVSCLRNCENGEALREAYGFGSGGTPTKSPGTDETGASPGSSASKEKSLKGTPNATPPAVRVSGKLEAPSSPATGEGTLTPRSSIRKKPFLMWTSFGRQEFDIAASTTSPFGYTHGQSLKATRGIDKDKVFHVVGVASGTLWVVEDGKPRAVPLRHCPTKEDIQERFGFTVVGKKDLAALAALDEEPTFTPVQTPRAASETPREFSSTPRGVVPPPMAVPSLNFAALSPASLLSASPSSSITLPPAQTAKGSCHRNYLKAVALLKTGAHGAADDPLRFHKYYMTNTGQRLGHAMSRINTFRDAYTSLCGENSTFERATTDEMLAVMRRKAELFT